MNSKKDVLYLDDFLILDNNLPRIVEELEDNYYFKNIYEIEEYKLSQYANMENIYKKINDSSDLLPFECINTNKQKENLDKSTLKLENSREAYKPKKTRGVGILREGYCDECSMWYKLKTSSYWYHMNYKHGVNSKGIKYPEPNIRNKGFSFEGYCTECNKWIDLGAKNNKKSVKFGWYKHWQKTHSVSKTI